MWKCWDGAGNNAYKIFTSQVEEGNIYKENILFGALLSYKNKETIFRMDKKINSMKPKSQNRGGDSETKNRNLSYNEVPFNNKRLSPNISKVAKENKEPVKVICWSIFCCFRNASHYRSFICRFCQIFVAMIMFWWMDMWQIYLPWFLFLWVSNIQALTETFSGSFP